MTIERAMRGMGVKSPASMVNADRHPRKKATVELKFLAETKFHE
jgi:hypothetical protein